MNFRIKFPSIDQIILAMSQVISRFPGAVLLSLISSSAIIYLINESGPDSEMTPRVANLAIVGGVGLPLLLAIGVMDRYGETMKRNYIMQFLALASLGLYYSFLPLDLSFSDISRLALLSISFHMFVAFAPFREKTEHSAFWTYNQKIFIRILLSTLYSGTLFVGLVLALVACDQLLGIKIREKSYINLFIFLSGVFHPWYFMAGMPDKQSGELEVEPYPKGLKLFTQFVLLPLVTVYLFILYIYAGKILISGDWPVGWVSYLIIGFSVAGILSLLLIHPISEDEENAWIKTYAKWFYAALFPLLFMLAIAIGKRVADYGITEKRYFVIIIAAWLFAISIYYLSKRKRPIRTIPISLASVALLCSFGPWGAFEVSKRSQINRITTMLLTNDKMENGKIQDLSDASNEVKKEASEILEYLIENHGVESVKPMLSFYLDSLSNNKKTHGRSMAPHVLKLVGLESSYHYVEESSQYQYFSSDENQVEDIKGFDYLLKYDFYISSGSEEEERNIDGSVFKIKMFGSPQLIQFEYEGEKQTIDLRTHIEDWKKLRMDNDNLPANSMLIESNISGRNLKIVFNHFTLFDVDDKPKMESCAFKLFISGKE